MQLKHPGIRLVVYSADDDSHSQKLVAGGGQIFSVFPDDSLPTS